MNDRVTGLLELYDIEAVRVRKGRGALLCDTDNGCFIFKEYNGSEQKAGLHARVLRKLADEGVSCERIFPTKEGALFCQDTDGRKYMLKSYFDNRECNIRDSQECREAKRSCFPACTDGWFYRPEKPGIYRCILLPMNMRSTTGS